MAEGYDAVELNGFYLDSRELHVGAAARETVPVATLADAEDSSGEWLGIFRHRDAPHTYAIAADPFGYMSTFVKLVETAAGATVLVASSARAMAYLHHQLNLDAALDWSYVTPWVVSGHALTLTPFVNDTGITGVRLLAPGEMIFVSPSEVRVVQRDIYTGSLSENYEG